MDLGNPPFSIKDSKKLSRQNRERAYLFFQKHPAIKWGIGRVSPGIIDKINILRATKLAMKNALRSLVRKLGTRRETPEEILQFLIIDGNFLIESPIRQRAIIKADEKVFSCALASIIAKVLRDRIMMRYHRQYPCYRFDMHKGYGTALHLEMLSRYGPCSIHRKSFAPIKHRVAHTSS